MVFLGDTFRIVGVAKAYHQESFKPLIFRDNVAPGGFIFNKINT